MNEKTVKEPRGIRNNNPLNIRKGNNWRGELKNQTDPEFEQFTSLGYGIRAALRLMRNQISGFGGSRPPMNTLKKLISVWAPPSENSTQRYVDFVSEKKSVASPLTQVIDRPTKADLFAGLARAMALMNVVCGLILLSSAAHGIYFDFISSIINDETFDCFRFNE